MGMPSSACFSPRANAASAIFAASRPRSKSRTQTALIFASCRSMRAIASLASSTADTFFAASAADRLTAVSKLHCDLAKGVLLLFLADDDARIAHGPQAGWPRSNHRADGAHCLVGVAGIRCLTAI